MTDILELPTNFESEDEFSMHIITRLMPHFAVYTRSNVRGVFVADDSITRNKVDAIIRPRNAELWKKQDVVFGVEFKNPDALDGTKDITKWLGQCRDYAWTKWSYRNEEDVWVEAGFIYILTCPGFSEHIANYENRSKDDYALTRRLLARDGIGELRVDKWRGLAIFKNEKHCIWSEKYGVETGKVENLVRQFGSR